MGRRLDFHEVLCRVMETALDPPPPNVRQRVYFQPPASIQMTYPCIVYEWSGTDVSFAQNIPYRSMKEYTVIVIDPDPDSTIPDALSKLPLARFDRHYVADNLNHIVFRIFY